MGTRCLTVVKEEGLDSDDICVLYAQFDGYPSGHGELLKSLFGKFVVVNGIPGTDKAHIANGMSCFAVQMITDLKNNQVKSHRKTMKRVREGMRKAHEEEPDKFPFYKDAPIEKHKAGNFYLYPAGTRDAGESYLYTVYLKPVPLPEPRDFRQLEPVGALQLRVETPEYDKQYQRTGNWRVLYDGDLKDFDSELCKEDEE